MKLGISMVSGVLALNLAAGASARPEDRWVKVKGGDWAPTAATIEKIREQIEPYVRAQVSAEGRNLEDWSSYTFQYQGREERGQKFVFVNAFCVRDGRWNLRKRMVLVLDGGTCFFNVKYDPKNGEFFELLVNGEA